MTNVMKEKKILRLALILPALCVLSTFTKAQVYINLNINQPPPLVVSVGAAQTICAGGNTSIEGTATGGKEPYAYAWSPSTGLSNATVANPVASPSATTTYTLTVSDANNCKSMDNVVITVDPCTGINNASGMAETGDFSIVPNPNQGSFSVVWSSIPINDLVVLEIYNFQGKRFYSGSFRNKNASLIVPINIDGMNKGIYLIKILHDNATYTEKFIIE